MDNCGTLQLLRTACYKWFTLSFSFFYVGKGYRILSLLNFSYLTPTWKNTTLSFFVWEKTFETRFYFSYACIMACLIACLIYVFKNWKLLFKNIYKNICWWKNVWKYIKYCLKIENDCLKTQTKHLLIRSVNYATWK